LSFFVDTTTAESACIRTV